MWKKLGFMGDRWSYDAHDVEGSANAVPIFPKGARTTSRQAKKTAWPFTGMDEDR